MTWSRQVGGVAAGDWGVRSLYQPIVDLRDRSVVGFEALTRGRTGTPLESPTALFEEARRQDAVADLDWACRSSAIRGALEDHLEPGMSLFVNVEPSALGVPGPPGADELLDRLAETGVRLVVEVTERGLARRPAQLLEFCDSIRRRGWALAVDDVGGDPASLALLPLLDPDVIKLDMRLIQSQPDVETARIVNAVNAQVASSGAAVVAEGIETDHQCELAQSMGAALGQGWLFGRPQEAPLPVGQVATAHRALAARRSHQPLVRHATPWDLVADSDEVRRSRKPLLVAMSQHLENQALAGDPATIVLGAFQHRRHLNATTLRRYEALGSAAFLVGMLAASMPTTPLRHVHRCELAPQDPLGQEWTVVVVGSHFAAALIARDVGDSADEGLRRFDYVLSYDRDIALAAARLMLHRFAGPLELEPA